MSVGVSSARSGEMATSIGGGGGARQLNSSSPVHWSNVHGLLSGRNERRTLLYYIGFVYRFD